MWKVWHFRKYQPTLITLMKKLLKIHGSLMKTSKEFFGHFCLLMEIDLSAEKILLPFLFLHWVLAASIVFRSMKLWNLYPEQIEIKIYECIFQMYVKNDRSWYISKGISLFTIASNFRHIFVLKFFFLMIWVEMLELDFIDIILTWLNFML